MIFRGKNSMQIVVFFLFLLAMALEANVVIAQSGGIYIVDMRKITEAYLSIPSVLESGPNTLFKSLQPPIGKKGSSQMNLPDDNKLMDIKKKMDDFEVKTLQSIQTALYAVAKKYQAQVIFNTTPNFEFSSAFTKAMANKMGNAQGGMPGGMPPKISSTDGVDTRNTPGWRAFSGMSSGDPSGKTPGMPFNMNMPGEMDREKAFTSWFGQSIVFGYDLTNEVIRSLNIGIAPSK